MVSTKKPRHSLGNVEQIMAKHFKHLLQTSSLISIMYIKKKNTYYSYKNFEIIIVYIIMILDTSTLRGEISRNA